MDWKTIKEQLISIPNFINEELAELKPQLCGSAYKIHCPSCGKPEAYIYEGGQQIVCNRQNNCSYSEPLFDYLMRRDGLNPDDKAAFAEFLKQLASRHGVAVPEDTEEMKRAIAQSKEKADYIKKADEIFREALFAPEGAKALEYIRGRGWNDTQIKEAHFGYNIGKDALQKAFNLSRLPDYFNNMFGATENLLTFPHLDAFGNILAIWGRRIDNQGENKYKPLTKADGTKGITPFGLRYDREATQILIVEGYMDVLKCKANGFRNVICVGGSKISDKHIETIKEAYPNAVATLAFDGDKAGKDGNIQAVKRLLENNMPCFVATLPEGEKDPDGVIRAQGVTKLCDYLASAEQGAKFVARQIIKGYDLSTPTGRGEVKQAILNLLKELPSRTSREDVLTLIDEEFDGFGYSRDALQQEFQRIIDENITKKEQEAIDAGLKAALSEPTTGAKFDKIKALLDKISASHISTKIEIPEPYTISDYKRDIAASPNSGLYTGFADFDASGIKLPKGAVSVILARPSEGKTTFLLNLLANLSRNYHDEAYIYVSYEERLSDITKKLFSVMTDVNSNISQIALEFSPQKSEQLLNTFDKEGKITRADINNITNGLREIEDATTHKRIYLLDNTYNYTATELKFVVEELIKTGVNVGGIIVDYIQKIAIEANSKQKTRQSQVAESSELLRQIAVDNNIAVIVGAQSNREASKDTEGYCFPQLHQIREAGDIEQDANIVIGLASPQKHSNTLSRLSEQDIMRSYTASDNDTGGGKTYIWSKILKNRNGNAFADRDFFFTFGPSLTVKKITSHADATALKSIFDAFRKPTSTNTKKRKDPEQNAAIDAVVDERTNANGSGIFTHTKRED